MKKVFIVYGLMITTIFAMQGPADWINASPSSKIVDRIQSNCLQLNNNQRQLDQLQHDLKDYEHAVTVLNGFTKYASDVSALLTSAQQTCNEAMNSALQDVDRQQLNQKIASIFSTPISSPWPFPAGMPMAPGMCPGMCPPPPMAPGMYPPPPMGPMAPMGPQIQPMDFPDECGTRIPINMPPIAGSIGMFLNRVDYVQTQDEASQLFQQINGQLNIFANVAMQITPQLSQIERLQTIKMENLRIASATNTAIADMMISYLEKLKSDFPTNIALPLGS